MTALSQPTAIDGYRWLKNDIIRGTYQPDEKLRMSLLTARYALGVGPLREALSQLVAEPSIGTRCVATTRVRLPSH